MVYMPNCHWNHTKIEFGMIPVVIWYGYHTSVFAACASSETGFVLEPIFLSYTYKMAGLLP